MAVPSKRKVLSVELKVNIIRDIESGVKRSDVCRNYGLVKSTLCTIWKDREKILKAFDEGSGLRRKIRKPDFEQLDQAMLTWFKLQRADNVPLTGPILKAKAEHFSRLFGVENFKCSDGWLDRFKQRHGIIFRKTPDSGTDMVLVKAWLENAWPKVGDDLTTPLVPGETFSFKNENSKMINEKLSDDQIVDRISNPAASQESSSFARVSLKQALDAARTLSAFSRQADVTAEFFEKASQLQSEIETIYWTSKAKRKPKS